MATEVDINAVLSRYQMVIATLTHDKIMAEARAESAEQELQKLRAEHSEEQ